MNSTLTRKNYNCHILTPHSILTSITCASLTNMSLIHPINIMKFWAHTEQFITFILQLYNQAMELCMQMYGELHILTSRLYINIGIVYEDNKVSDLLFSIECMLSKCCRVFFPQVLPHWLCVLESVQPSQNACLAGPIIQFYLFISPSTSTFVCCNLIRNDGRWSENWFLHVIIYIYIQYFSCMWKLLKINAIIMAMKQKQTCSPNSNKFVWSHLLCCIVKYMTVHLISLQTCLQSMHPIVSLHYTV